MATIYADSDELLDLHIQAERDRSKLELRIERLEDAALQRDGKVAGQFAKRSDVEAFMDDFDELVSIVKRQQKLIEFLYFYEDLDPEKEVPEG